MLDCTPIAMGGVEDHVHVLVRIPPEISPSELVRQLKGVSSHLVNAEINPDGVFKWQGGYGAFSMSSDQVARVRWYIENQPSHHQNKTVINDWEQDQL
jgi:REP element-mobilizing transposase RayT